MPIIHSLRVQTPPRLVTPGTFLFMVFHAAPDSTLRVGYGGDRLVDLFKSQVVFPNLEGPGRSTYPLRRCLGWVPGGSKHLLRRYDWRLV